MWIALQSVAFGGQAAFRSTKGNKRRKLQKPIRDKSKDIVEDCEVLSLPVSSPVSLSASLPSPVPLDKADDDVMTSEQPLQPSQPSQPRNSSDSNTVINTAIRGDVPQIAMADFPNRSVNSLSIYSFDQMAVEMLKRTRAKTPCFWVGQLECHKNDDSRYDSAMALAGEYQAVLPPRTFTPCLEPQRLGRTIRKVKGRQSLREIVEQDELRDSVDSNARCHDNYSYNDNNDDNHNHNNDHNHTSDCDTLVGSDFPTSPITPRSAYLPRPKSPLFPFVDAKTYPQCHDSCLEHSTSMGFQMCLDLLTQQLATGLFKKHPAEHLDRASGLQIQLMIEAYESVLLHTRGEMAGPHLTGPELGHLAEIEQTLDHWIRALYSVHDQTRTRSIRSIASFRSCRSSFSSSTTLLSSPAD